jgi:hypothetical protein
MYCSSTLRRSYMAVSTRQRQTHINPPTCNQSAIWVFSRSTWVMRSLRTVTACAGKRVDCALREWKLAGGLGAAYQQCWVFFTLELHGANMRMGRTATVERPVYLHRNELLRACRGVVKLSGLAVSRGLGRPPFGLDRCHRGSAGI